VDNEEEGAGSVPGMRQGHRGWNARGDRGEGYVGDGKGRGSSNGGVGFRGFQRGFVGNGVGGEQFGVAGYGQGEEEGEDEGLLAV